MIIGVLFYITAMGCVDECVTGWPGPCREIMLTTAAAASPPHHWHHCHHHRHGNGKGTNVGTTDNGMATSTATTTVMEIMGDSGDGNNHNTVCNTDHSNGIGAPCASAVVVGFRSDRGFIQKYCRPGNRRIVERAY
jgi:hypothetical protein